MSSVIKNEFKIMVSSTRINRIRYLAYCSFLSLCLILFVVCASFIFPDKNNLLFKLIICSGAIFFVFYKIWFSICRINDTGRSFWYYLLFAILGITLALLPSKINFSMLPLGKILTAISYLAGMLFYLYAACMMIFFRGTAGDNKYGSVPPANNYLTNSMASIYVAFLIAIYVVVFLNQSAILKLQRESAAALEASNSSIVAMQTNDLNIALQ